jgi:hypothetical protein
VCISCAAIPATIPVHNILLDWIILLLEIPLIPLLIYVYPVFFLISHIAKSELKNTIFWVIWPCSSEITRRFGGTYYPHLQCRTRNQKKRVSPCLAQISIVEMEITCSSETSGYLRTRTQKDILFIAISVRISTVSELQSKAVTAKTTEVSLRHNCVIWVKYFSMLYILNRTQEKVIHYMCQQNAISVLFNIFATTYLYLE